MSAWLRSAVDLPDEDLDEDLAPPPPDPEDADDLPPWHHPDPWTSEQARDAYWEHAEELARG